MTPRKEGYIYVAITMFIWGGFTILSRLNAQWNISAWDITALRFGFAFLILMPILLYKKNMAFLWAWRPIILALTGGIAYCLTVYAGFIYAPATHGAIFLNGFIPLTTAITASIILKDSFDRHMWYSFLIMLISIIAMIYLISLNPQSYFGVGDLLLVMGATLWGVFTVLLKMWRLSAWQAMTSVAIWSALIYLPVYLLFLPKQYHSVSGLHLVVQGLFHGVLVVIVATLTYIAAIERLGAFKAGSIITLAPFLAAVLAVPMLNEPLSPPILCGLIGMSIGALQPWRWRFKDMLTIQLEKQKKNQRCSKAK